jgi:flagellar protein FlbD
VIRVHRLKGEAFVVNADIIETIESTPDTVLRLVDGRRAIVAETPDEIVELVVEFRASILRAAGRVPDAGVTGSHRPRLTVLPRDEG